MASVGETMCLFYSQGIAGKRGSLGEEGQTGEKVRPLAFYIHINIDAYINLLSNYLSWYWCRG